MKEFSQRLWIWIDIKRISYACIVFMLIVNSVFGAQNVDKRSINKQIEFLKNGLDSGIVLQNTYIFSDYRELTSKIGVAKKSDIVVIVSRESKDGWINIIQYETGRQGWIKESRLSVKYSKGRSDKLNFNAEYLETVDNPKIVITNDSNEGLYFHLGSNSELYIGAHKQESIVVTPGIYSYNVAAPQILPLFGTRSLLPGYKYAWSFYIGKTGQSKKAKQVDPKLLEENNKLLSDRKDLILSLEKLKRELQADKLSLSEMEVKLNSDSATIEAIKKSIDDSTKEEIDKYNELIKSYNELLETYKSVGKAYNDKVLDYNTMVDALKKIKDRLAQISNTVKS